MKLLDILLIGVGMLMASVVLILVKAETKWLGTKKPLSGFPLLEEL